MQAMLHGYRRVDMADSQTGAPINGFSCFISYPSEGVVGVETSKQWVSAQLASENKWHPEVGKLLNIDYTPKGRVSSISTVQEK